MIHTVIIITGLLLLIYALLIFYYHRIWDRIPDTTRNKLNSLEVYTHVSIIIPARNEEAHIGKCLKALIRQSYPEEYMQIIVVNDFSTDSTASHVLEFSPRCTLINLSEYFSGETNSFKKKALDTGIRQSTGELILCTDADCIMGSDWLLTIVTAFQKEKAEFIASPVAIIPDERWISIFQCLDFISLQGITGAAVSRDLYPMCNGANLAYSRRAYDAVGGFAGIDHIASGDDMLLMRKIRDRFPGKTIYVKDRRAIVKTAAVDTISAFFRQRIRWASKISHYRDPATFITLALVYLVNLSLLVLLVSCFFYEHWRWLILFLAFKTVSEYFFVSKVAGFFGQLKLMRYFSFCQPPHILYTIVAGAFGSFGKYEWKNRIVK